jgi:predicted transcriptional regulator
MSRKSRTSSKKAMGDSAGRALQVVPERPAPARTDTEHKLWKALRANSRHTTAELAELAKIGRSTAGKILARWADDGSVTRISGIADGLRRADVWSIDDTDRSQASPAIATEQQDESPASRPPEPIPDADSEPSEHRPSPATSQSDDSATGADETEPSKSHRLAPGALRGLVEDFLRDHPGEEFSPNQIAKQLNRSAGAVNNALERLVADGLVARTKEKPKRFSLANEQQ